MTNEEAIKIITGVMNQYHIDSMTNQRIDEALSVAIEALKAKPKHGYFRPAKDGHSCECSECGTAYGWIEADTMRYCKRCGARIDGEEK